ERLVLGFPSKARDGAGIAVEVRLAGDRAAGQDDIGPAENAHRALVSCVSGLVRRDLAVRYLFDQARAENRGGNPEDDVVVGELPGEIWLRKDTPRRVLPTGDGEKVVHAAIRRPVRVSHEPCLTHGTVCRDERGNAIGG